MKTILFIISLCFLNVTIADTYLTATMGSYHSNRDIDYNEHNYGTGINYNQWVIGGYNNSHEKTSIYAGYEYKQQMNAYAAYGVQAGLLTGYKNSELSAPSYEGTFLYALPVLILGKDIKYKIGIAPVDEWVITFQIDFRI